MRYLSYILIKSEWLRKVNMIELRFMKPEVEKGLVLMVSKNKENKLNQGGGQLCTFVDRGRLGVGRCTTAETS
jgi:hypothetical protein